MSSPPPGPPPCPRLRCTSSHRRVSPLILFRSLSRAPFSPPSFPLSSSAIAKSCCLFLRRDWQLYSRRMLVYCTRTHIHEYTYMYVYVCTHVQYARGWCTPFAWNPTSTKGRHAEHEWRERARNEREERRKEVEGLRGRYCARGCVRVEERARIEIKST